jgi:hypothetical protein
VVAVDERGDDCPGDEAAGHVDQKRAPGKDAEGAVLDQAVEPIAGECAEGAAQHDCECNRHGGSFRR